MSAKLLVFTAPVAGREDEFNAWQSEVHIPELLEKVDGFAAATRYRNVEGTPGLRPYVTVWELSKPALEVMAELAEALPTLQESEALDHGENKPTLMVYEAM